jgi:alpha-glucuronidase
VGDDTNWTGSQMNQANWYAYGRLAWDPNGDSKTFAEEWVRQTFTNDPAIVTPVVDLMMNSREAVVNYMTPLGLVHIMGTDHHYGPAPWVSNLSTDNWNPFYYHKANADGIGYDRTASGSNAVEQYATEVGTRFGTRASVPDEYLLFFQRVNWSDKVGSSDRTVWQELVHRYSLGVDQVDAMKKAWASVDGYIDAKRFKEISDFLQIQHYEARWWRDACLTYFADAGQQAIPAGYAAPAQNLNYYKNLNCPADVKKPRCSEVYTGEPSPAITP